MRLAAYVARWWHLTIAPSTVQRLLRRLGLATRRERLLVHEHWRVVFRRHYFTGRGAL